MTVENYIFLVFALWFCKFTCGAGCINSMIWFPLFFTWPLSVLETHYDDTHKLKLRHDFSNGHGHR